MESDPGLLLGWPPATPGLIRPGVAKPSKVLHSPGVWNAKVTSPSIDHPGLIGTINASPSRTTQDEARMDPVGQVPIDAVGSAVNDQSQPPWIEARVVLGE